MFHKRLTEMARARRARRIHWGDAGEQSTGYILIVALSITIALAVGAILTSTIVAGAENIDLGLTP